MYSEQESHLAVITPLTARDSGVHEIETNPVARLLKYFYLNIYSFICLFVFVYIHVCLTVCVYVLLCMWSSEDSWQETVLSRVFGIKLWSSVLMASHLTYWAILLSHPFKNIFFLILPFKIALYFTSHMKRQIPASFDSDQSLFVLNDHQRHRRETNIYKLCSEMSAQRCPARSWASQQGNDWNEIKRVT